MADEAAAAQADARARPRYRDTVVLVPHCRMSGAARVAGLFTDAARAAGGPDSVAVIATDLPVFERPNLFPDDVRVLDLAGHLAGMAQPARRDVLHDLLRELRPRRIVLINSLLGWQLVSELGDQLAEVMDVGAYLFTWELDEHGHPYGYPVGPFRQSIEHLSWVLFDSERMRSELVDRFLMHEEASARMIFLRNPVAEWSVDVTGVFERRRAAGLPLRALWAGRFDRQKRFDLVVAIARLLPELEICAWGKPVLRDIDLDLDDLPPNIRLMGVYDGFDQLPAGRRRLPPLHLGLGRHPQRRARGCAERPADRRERRRRRAGGGDARDRLSGGRHRRAGGVRRRDRAAARRSRRRRPGGPPCSASRCTSSSTRTPTAPRSRGSSRAGTGRERPGDITAVLIARDEGPRIGISLHSLLDSARAARSTGLDVEQVVVLADASAAPGGRSTRSSRTGSGC